MGINLPAGRELDALVAEKVMEFKRYAMSRHASRYILLQEPWEGMVTAHEDAEPYADCLREVPPYSTDTTAAWQVVEKLMADGFHYQLTYLNSTIGAPFWSCSFNKSTFLDNYGSAPNAALAICRSALRAVGYKEG